MQLREGVGFAEVAGLGPALAELGISHVYLSPVFEAVPGSTHGYDVADPRRLREALGGEPAWHAMVETLRAHSIGVVIDIVPNHLARSVEANAMWRDVVRFGPASRYAPVFDVSWRTPGQERDRVLLAVLDDHYGRVLADGRVHLARHGEELVVRVDDVAYPLDPASLVACAIATDDDVARVNADLDSLDALLELQHYRLAHWRVARHELDYRRFFDVDTLIAVRAEAPGVFDLTHELVLALVAAGDVEGLRVDHVDGLRQPGGYLAELAARAPGTWLVVEKILHPGEDLPSWPVAGTTGYDALRDIQGVLTDPAGEAPLTERWCQVTGDDRTFADVALAAKREVLTTLLVPDLERLVDAARAALGDRRRWRDLARAELRDAIVEVFVALPVYRTYLADADGSDRAADRALVEATISLAATAAPTIDALAFDAVRTLLCAPTEFVARFEQLAGPVMAKGVEDTAFYRYHRFVAANEVGIDPGHWAISPAAFHAANLHAAEHHPERMVTTSTHDTKRSEDVRARLLVLAERPTWWAAFVDAWNVRDDQRGVTIDAPTRYLLQQTLVGAHPLDRDRAAAFVTKAAREAKVHTSWLLPDEAYEAQVRAYLDDVYADDELLASLAAFVTSIEPMARANTLAQVLLRCTVPGVPDCYQHNEDLAYSLVDPDNRAPLDPVAFACAVDAARHAPADAVDPGAKRWVMRQALGVRGCIPGAFGPTGGYGALLASGERSDHVLAFSRGGAAITVVTRLPAGVRDGWAGSELALPPGEWVDVLAGRAHRGTVAMDELLTTLPVALLVARPHADPVPT